jgi:DNA polymerase III delta prime subunit
MELKEQLEIVDVQFEDNKKAVIIFLDEEMGEIREVNFNKQKFDTDSKKFVDDAEKAAQVEEWCAEHFGIPFDRLAECIGERKDVYCYDNFNSVFPVKMIQKFDDDMVGQIFEVEIVHAEDDGKKISLQFEYDGGLYESKMQYADYLEARKEWFINPQKKKKQFEKFLEKFQMPVDEIENMIGKTVLVEVKKAMGKYVYSEIKPFAKKKKKTS